MLNVARSRCAIMCGGTPKMPREYVEDWLAMVNKLAVGWPRNWQRALVSAWRKDHRKGWKAGRKKNAARERWQVEKDLEGMQEQIKQHPFGCWPVNRKMPPTVKEEYEALVKEKKRLEAELAGGNDQAKEEGRMKKGL